MTSEELAKMRHEALYRLRAREPEYMQGLLAPYEHRAFAREVVGENPLMALPLLAAVPAYTGAKAIGAVKARSPASWAEVIQGLLGIKEGLSR